MAYGFFTIEQWKSPPRSGKGRWIAIAHLDMGHSLSDALAEIERRNRGGFFRVTQTQRVVWAHRVAGKLVLKKWHAGRAASLRPNAFLREQTPAKQK